MCACRKIRNEKHTLNLSLKLVNADGYDFPTHVTAPKIYPSFMWPFHKYDIPDTQWNLALTGHL